MLEMRNVLTKKLNKKGFTLAELLVVVAIIAILVAVSIPIFAGKLNKAKEATDLANLRAAKAAAVTEYISEGALANTYYDAENGALVTDAAAKNLAGYGQASDNKDKIVQVTLTPATTTEEAKIVAQFVAKPA